MAPVSQTVTRCYSHLGPFACLNHFFPPDIRAMEVLYTSMRNDWSNTSPSHPGINRFDAIYEVSIETGYFLFFTLQPLSTTTFSCSPPYSLHIIFQAPSTPPPNSSSLKMVGWGTEPGDIENPQRVASSEGEELYVGTAPHPHSLPPFSPLIHPRNPANFVTSKEVA